MTATSKPAATLGRPASAGLIAVVVRFFSSARSRQRSRHALGQLSDHMLRDIGLDRATARAEASRRFWQD